MDFGLYCESQIIGSLVVKSNANTMDWELSDSD